MKNILLKLALPVFLLVAFSGQVFGQYYNTIFWMQGIPQSAYSNPALMPKPRFYVGMPSISSLYTGIGNSGFSIGDVLLKDPLNNLYIDEDNLINRLRSNNYLDFDFQNEWLAFGFRARRSYVSFNITEKMGARFAYPNDLFTLLLKGNDYFLEEGRPGNFAGLGLDFVHYREFGFSFSREWTDRLTAGFRLKALQGLSNVWFEKSELSLNTDPENFDLLLNANLLVNIAAPVSFIPLDSLGSEFEFDADYVDYISNFNNRGGAIDIGLTYKPVDRLTLALSATDLGFIDWKHGVENFSMNGEFEFKGIDVLRWTDEAEEGESSADQFLDSLRTIFDITETANAYRQKLPARFYFSAAYDLTPRQKIGILSRAELYNGQLYPSFTFSYNVMPIHAFSMAVSYSVIHWNYRNLGLGFNLNLGPLQIYLVSDNIFGGFQPHTMQHFNARLGLNWVFGYRPKKEDAVPSISF
jgi:hypothetical protein